MILYEQFKKAIDIRHRIVYIGAIPIMNHMKKKKKKDVEVEFDFLYIGMFLRNLTHLPDDSTIRIRK